MDRIREKNGFILTSIQNTEGLAFIRLGEPQTLTVRILNLTPVSYRVKRGMAPPTVPRITIDLRSANAEVTLDPDRVSCNGFAVSEWHDGVLELSMRFLERWWFPGTAIEVVLPDVVLEGSAGAGIVPVAITDFAGADQRHNVALFRLAPEQKGQATFAPNWLEKNQVVVSRPGVAQPNDLAIEVGARDLPADAASGEVFLSFAPRGTQPLLATPSRLETITVTTGDAWTPAPFASHPVPVWRFRRAGGIDDRLLLGNIITRGNRGTSAVVMYAIGFEGLNDGYAALDVALESGSVQFTAPLTVTPPTLTNITQPTAVFLSWNVVGATSVTLSGVGVVSASQQKLQVMIEQTTTFVAIAFDSSLNQIATSTATVTCDPPLVQRLVPSGTIAIWSGDATNIPPFWFLCDGTNNTPDLRDRFILGAAGAEAPGAMASADTHTHGIGSLSATFTTQSAGAHSHGMPTAWFKQSVSSGNDNAIAGPLPAQTQTSGSHTHNVDVTFGSFDSTTNNGDIRPPWYALCFIMKG